MKKHILWGAALLSFFAASCINENVIDNGKDVSTGKTVTLNATISNGADSRLVYDDNSSKITVAWSSNESFTMYKGTNETGSTFSNSAEATGVFTGTDIEGTGTYYAVYGNYITNNAKKLTIDLTGAQVGTSTENGIKEFMLATTETVTAGTTLSFTHKLTVLKLTLTFPADVSGTVSKVTVGGLHNKATYNLDTDTYGTYANKDKGGITATNGTTGFDITDHKITAYVAVFPESVAANQLTISAEVDDCEYFYTISASRVLVAGKVVPVNVTWAKALSSNSGSLTEAAVRAALNNNNNNLVIESNEDLTNDDFAVLRNVFADYPAGSINLTLLNQEKIPTFDEFCQTGALLNCTALKSVSAPNLTFTGQDCFMGCTSLSLVSLPKVEFVRIQTFSGCTSLTSISLPEATRVGTSTFNGCYSLTSLYLPKVTDIDYDEYTNENAFTGCPRGVISVSVKDETDWWKQWGGTDADNYGWASVNVIKTNFKTTIVKSDYYKWDAELNYADGGTASPDSVATHSCKDAPTRDQLMMYLGSGVYWDDGAEGDNQQTYTTNGEVCHAGLWMKKKKYIRGFSDGTATRKVDVVIIDKDNSDLFHMGRPAATEIYKYFFLPATGRYMYDDFKYSNTAGYYWSSTYISKSNSYICRAYCLNFDKESATVLNIIGNPFGMRPMIAE